MQKILLILISAIGLASCTARTNDSHICATPDPLDISGTASQDKNTTSCIHRWAYRLALSSDDANEVAHAVVGACRDAIDLSIVGERSGVADKHPDGSADKGGFYKGQKAVKNDGSAEFEYQGDTKGWVNITEKDDDRRLAKYEEQALFRVVQARAGKCKVP